MIHSYNGTRPSLGKDVYVAPGGQVIGDVKLEDRASVWFNAVIRGDVAPVVIGSETNVQDNSVIHVRNGRQTRLGSGVTVGHSVTLHACDVGDYCLIGMGSTVLDEARVETGAMVGANSLVTQGTVIPEGHLAVGSPAQVQRELTDEESRELRDSASRYVNYAQAHADSN